MGRLDGKGAVITGASAGIGRTTAMLFAAEGAKVVAGARRQAELDLLVAEIRATGAERSRWPATSVQEAYAQALGALARDRFSRLDIGFNNVRTAGEERAEVQKFRRPAPGTMPSPVNLTGAFLGAKHQIAEMVKHGGGSVIFTSTFVGYTVGFPGMAAYAASKSGLIGVDPSARCRIRAARG